MTLSSSTGCVKLSLNQVQLAIDTAGYPTAHTKAKAIHDKSQAVSGEVEAAFAGSEKKDPLPQKKRSTVDLLYV